MPNLATAFEKAVTKTAAKVEQAQWQLLGWPSEAAWRAAGSPNTRYGITAGATAAQPLEPAAAPPAAPLPAVDATAGAQVATSRLNSPAVEPAPLAPVDPGAVIPNFLQGVNQALSPEGAQQGYGFAPQAAAPPPGLLEKALGVAGDVVGIAGDIPLANLAESVPVVGSPLSALLKTQDAATRNPATLGEAAAFSVDEEGNPVSRFIGSEIRPRVADAGQVAGDLFGQSAPGIGLNAGLSAIGAAGGPKLDSGDLGRAVGEYGTPVSPLDLILSLVVPATSDPMDVYRILKGSSLFDDAGRFLPGVTRSQVDNVLRQFGKTVDDLPELPIGAADALVKGTPVDQGTDAARLLSGPGVGREIPAPRPGIGGAGDEAAGAIDPATGRRLFHGTDAEFDEFDISKAKSFGEKFGLWFTDSEDFAQSFGRNVKEAVVNLQNPKILTQAEWDDLRGLHAKDAAWFSSWKSQLREQGFDGLWVKGQESQLGRFTLPGQDVFAAFDNAQVRAASALDEVPAGRATPPVGTAAEVPPSGAATSAAPASPPPPRTPRGTTPTGPMSEGDAVLALRKALREGTGAERARLVAEGRAAQAARLRGAIDATSEQGRALADQVRGAGAGRMLPDEGLGFTLPKEADDALIDKAMRMMQDGKMSPQEAVYGVVNALDEGRRLGPTPYQAKVLSKLTSIDEAAFAPYVRARAGLDADWRKMVDDELGKVIDPQPNVQSQLRSAKRAELEAERFDIQGKSEQAASARLRAATHNAKADALRAENIRKASEAQFAATRKADMRELTAVSRDFPYPNRSVERIIQTMDNADQRAVRRYLNESRSAAERAIREAEAQKADFLTNLRKTEGAALWDVARDGRVSPRATDRLLNTMDAAETRGVKRIAAEVKRAQVVESERLARLQREADTAQQAWNRAMLQNPQSAMKREGEVAERFVQQFDNIDKTPETIIDEAFKKITDGAFEGTLGTEDAINAFEVLKYHLQGNRAVLDSLKNADGWREYTAAVRAVATGELADSYLTSLIHRTMWLGQGLRESGIEPSLANKVVNAVRNAELRVRFPDGVPARVLRELDTMKAAPYEESLKGLELFVQRFKNTMFSTDLGVIGIQGRAALRRGGVNMFAGLINKRLAALGMPNVDVFRADVELPKRLRNIIDGLSVGAGQSPVKAEAGSMFSYLGPWGKQLDETVIAAAMDRANRIQFDGVMGWVGDSAYEGNLAILHALGRNINDPAVRTQAAEAANMIKSFGRGALRSKRSGIERNLLTSSLMTRAGIENIVQMAKFINPTATAEQRIIAATLIASQAVYMLTMGKFINDQIGITDFVMDPSLPGFGTVTTNEKDASGRNIVIDLVPQASVERAIARSFRELTEGDLDEASKVWLRYASGRSSVLGAGLLGVAGVGYASGANGGFRYGDLGTTDRVLNFVPLPPIMEGALREGFDISRAALDFVGVSSYGESGFSPLNRARQQAIEALIADGTLPEDLYPQGINYYDLGPGSRDLVNAHVRAESPNLITDYEAERRDRDNIYQKTADRAALNEAGRGATLDAKTGEVTGGEYTRSLELSMNGIATAATEITEARAIMDNARKNYDASQAAKRAAYQTEEYQKAIDGLPKTDINVQLADWYEVYYQAQDPNTGLIDYDIVDKAHEELLAQWQELDPQSVNKFLFELDNQEREYPEIIQMDKDLKNIQRDTGYYDLESDAEIEQWWADHPQEAAMSWLLGGRKLPTIEAMNEALNFQSIGLGEGRTDVTLKGFSFPVSTPDDLVTFANLYDVVERDYLSLESGKRGSYLDKNPDMNALLVFLGYDVKLRDGAEAELARLEARYGSTVPATEVVSPDVAPVMSFLEAGKATHPDEREPQEEYDAMMAATQTGEGIDEAIAIAQSHLDAHKRALLPENLNNLQFNPYVGEPEKNQEAIDGFTRVIAYLQSLKGQAR